jgi:hypothetical protein
MFNQMMRYLKEDTIIKSNQENLLNNLYDLYALKYPYILLKAQNELEHFLLCGLKSCKSEVKTPKEIEKSL